MPTPNPEMLQTIARQLGQSITGKTGMMDQAMRGLAEQPKLAEYLNQAKGLSTVPTHLRGALESSDLMQEAASAFKEGLHPSQYLDTAKQAISALLRRMGPSVTPREAPAAPSAVAMPQAAMGTTEQLAKSASTGQSPQRAIQAMDLITQMTPKEKAIVQGMAEGKTATEIAKGLNISRQSIAHAVEAMRKRLLGQELPETASKAHPGPISEPAPSAPPVGGGPPQANLPMGVLPEGSPPPLPTAGMQRTYKQIFPEEAPVRRRPPGEMPPGQFALPGKGGMLGPPGKLPPLSPKPEAVEELPARRARALKKRETMTK